jgi:hypothetical protein
MSRPQIPPVSVPGVGPVAGRKFRLPAPGYSAIELLLHFQTLGRPVLKSWQTTAFLKACRRKGASRPERDALADYLGGPDLDNDIEVQQDFVVHADGAGRFTKRIKNPRLEEFGRPGAVVLLQDYTIILKRPATAFERPDFELHGGVVVPVPGYPKRSGELARPIPELGLPKGALVFVNNRADLAHGLRNIYRTFWIAPDRRDYCTTIQWRDGTHGNLSCRALV